MPPHPPTTRRAPLAACGLAALLGAGCAADPPPPEPAPAPATEAAPPAAPGPAAPGPTATAPPPVEPELPAPRPRVGNAPADPAPGEGPRRVVVAAARTFPPELLERLRVDDLVEVELTRSGGRARGQVKAIKPTELVVAAEGTQIMTRLAPAEIRDVRVVFREQERLEAIGADDPRDPAEGWTDRFADRAALEGVPAELWTGRYVENMPLTVTRPFSLAAYTYGGRKGGTPTYAPSATRATLREGDQLKLVATSLGVEPRPGGADRALPELFLYLVRRGSTAELVASPDALQPSNLDRASVERWAKDEPVTLGAYRPGEARRWVRITRVPSTTARSWAGSLERTPERAALRQWRASKPAELAPAEARVKKLYAAVGLTKDTDLEAPLVFELRIPTTTGGLRLLTFRKELGLD